jgi:hypothetical protein
VGVDVNRSDPLSGDPDRQAWRACTLCSRPQLQKMTPVRQPRHRSQKDYGGCHETSSTFLSFAFFAYLKIAVGGRAAVRDQDARKLQPILVRAACQGPIWVPVFAVGSQVTSGEPTLQRTRSMR